MKSINLYRAVALLRAVAIAALVAVGCEQTTTSTGPGPVMSNDKAANSPVKKLSLTAAQKQTIVRGGTDDVAIKIDRKNFNAPVTIRLSDLPQGVEATPSTDIVIPAGADSTTVKLKAADDAAIGQFKIDIDAQAEGLANNVQTFTLAVTEKGSAVPALGPK